MKATGSPCQNPRADAPCGPARISDSAVTDVIGAKRLRLQFDDLLGGRLRGLNVARFPCRGLAAQPKFSDSVVQSLTICIELIVLRAKLVWIKHWHRCDFTQHRSL